MKNNLHRKLRCRTKHDKASKHLVLYEKENDEREKYKPEHQEESRGKKDISWVQFSLCCRPAMVPVRTLLDHVMPVLYVPGCSFLYAVGRPWYP
jgi:hypothetical protein